MADRSFCLSWVLADQMLTESIAAYGLINPPLLFGNTPDPYKIVCGFKRIISCKKLGWKAVPATIVEGQPDALQCLYISFWDNLPHRQFNLVEKALIVRKFSAYLDEKQLLSKILPRLQLHAHHRELKRYLRIEELPNEAKEALARKALTVEAALLLLEFDAQSQVPLLHFILGLRLSASRQRELMELIFEICRRESMNPLEIISQEAVAGINNREELSQPQKSFLICQWLRKKRYPRMSEAESSFAAWLRGLHLESNISIQPPPYFEGKARSIRFTVASYEEMGKVLETLFNLYRDGKFKPLFDDRYGL
jgi:ParB-like chromosome segregation protein Spo0J